MLVVDTLLQNYDDGGVLGKFVGIAIAIAECAAHLRRLSCLHGEINARIKKVGEEAHDGKMMMRDVCITHLGVS